MFPTPSSSIRLFRVAGVNVFLHWSWLVVALFELSSRGGTYTNPAWNAAEYLTLFGMVLLHELGHALACRQVGGVAIQVVLWPLGGVAYVRPPARPGAVLWSIAAGPLVNLALVPVTVGLLLIARQVGWSHVPVDLRHYLLAVAVTNGVLLVFNLLPIYPLDGGQILHALLWFAIGQARSLLVASAVGLAAGAALLGYALWDGRSWLAVLAGFGLCQAFGGFQRARAMARGGMPGVPRPAAPSPRAPVQRRAGAACPSCGTAPVVGRFWVCARCEERFDTFEHHATCPSCGTPFPTTSCPTCRQKHPLAAWLGQTVAAR